MYLEQIINDLGRHIKAESIFDRGMLQILFDSIMEWHNGIISEKEKVISDKDEIIKELEEKLRNVGG